MTTTTTTQHQTTRKIMKIARRSQYVDRQTGEMVEQHVFRVEERDANFHKMWLWHLAAALDLIGNQKIKILSYIMEHMRSDNIFIGTQRAIADATETAVKTVSITLKLLQEADIIKQQQGGVYQVNPEVVYRGGGTQRLDIIYQYHQPNNNNQKKK